jgi:hypothetical protein
VNIQLKVAGNTIKENDLSRYFNTLDGVDYVGVVHGEEKQECALEHCFLFTTYYYKWKVSLLAY